MRRYVRGLYVYASEYGRRPVTGGGEWISNHGLSRRINFIELVVTKSNDCGLLVSFS
jgi:hypothetical protein